MDIDTLRVLAEVARVGSFADAARARGQDPSTVSRLVAQAEAALGARLFQRTTRRLSLTEAGAAFLRRIEPVIDEFDAAREAARGLQARPVGVLRFTASVAYGQTCVTPLLTEWRAAMPELGLDLILSDDALDLVRERIDLAIRLGPAVEGDVVCSRLHRTRYRVCASPDYLARAPALRMPQDLAAHATLRQALPDYRRRWLFRGPDRAVTEVAVDGPIVISSALALRDAARQGLGPALLADWLADRDLATGVLVDVFPEHDAAATRFDTAAWIVYPSRAFLPAKTRAAIDFLRARLGRR